MEFFEEIISRIPQEREKVEDCIAFFFFFYSICNHCDSIGFTLDLIDKVTYWGH